MKLYEIDQAIDQIFDETEDGELTHEQTIILESLRDAMNETLEHIAKASLEAKADAEKCGTEIKRLQDLKRTYENKAERAKDYVKQYMIDNEISSIKGEHVKLSLRDTPGKLEVIDSEEISFVYLEPQPPKFKQSEALKDLRAGMDVPGCKLVKSKTLQIK